MPSLSHLNFFKIFGFFPIRLAIPIAIAFSQYSSKLLTSVISFPQNMSWVFVSIFSVRELRAT